MTTKKQRRTQTVHTKVANGHIPPWRLNGPTPEQKTRLQTAQTEAHKRLGEYLGHLSDINRPLYHLNGAILTGGGQSTHKRALQQAFAEQTTHQLAAIETELDELRAAPSRGRGSRARRERLAWLVGERNRLMRLVPVPGVWFPRYTLADAEESDRLFERWQAAQQVVERLDWELGWRGPGECPDPR